MRLTKELEKEIRDISFEDSHYGVLLKEIDALRIDAQCDLINAKVRWTQINSLEKDLEQLKSELENERMKLAACGVAAMCNTKESKIRQGIGKDNPYWSVSYNDVCDAVDREIKLREERNALEAENQTLRKQIKTVHKSVEYYDHLCCDPTLTSGTGCCTLDWSKVTCEECLELKEASR